MDTARHPERPAVATHTRFGRYSDPTLSATAERRRIRCSEYHRCAGSLLVGCWPAAYSSRRIAELRKIFAEIAR